MPQKNFFYRLNNFLLLAVVIFVGILLYSDSQVAHSQTPTPTNTSTGTIALTSLPSYVINQELSVSMDPGDFTAHFVSDGFTGKSTDEAQKAKFYKKDNGAPADLELIDVPIKFEFDAANSKAILPGTLFYPYLPKNTAPSDYRCVEKGKATDNQTNEMNCMFGVTMLSAYTDSTTANIVVGNQSYKVVTNSTDVYTNLTDTLKSALQSFGRVIARNTGTPDQSREAVGTIRYWGDDSYQQFVPISGGTQTKRPVLYSKGSTDVAGNNADEGLFASDFTPGINVLIGTRYKQANVLALTLCPGGENGGIPICPQGQITEPFTSRQNGPNDILNAPTGEVTLEEITNALLKVVTSNNQTFVQKQERLSAQISLRATQETTKFTSKYSLCDAFEQDDRNFNLQHYRNIYADASGNCPSSTKIVNGIPVPNPDYNSERGRNCRAYEDLKKSNPKVTKCIYGVSKYVSEDSAVKCEKSWIENGYGCDEFSVEEGGFNLSQMEAAFPLGLGAYFQNATLQSLDPANMRGPFINYLSADMCGKLNLAFKIKPGASYMYDVGTADGKSSGTIRDPITGKTIESDYVNQYCIVGGYFSVFSYSLFQMAVNNYSVSNPSGIINMPKTDLTCDKKETIYLGAVPSKTNIDYPEGKPVYITDDNTREANRTKDEVVVYHGYEAYPLTEILKDKEVGIKSLSKYGNLDMQVVIHPQTKKPKYVVLSGVIGKEGDNTIMGMYLCKFPKNQDRYGEKIETSLCKQIDKGGFVYPTFSSMTVNFVNLPKGNTRQTVDTITVLYGKPGEKSDPEKQEVPFVYKMIDVIDEMNVGSALVSDRFFFKSDARGSIDAVELPSGQIGVVGVKRGNDTFKGIYLSTIDPYQSSSAKFEFNSEGNAITGVKRSASETSLGSDLCVGNDYCNVLNSFGYINSAKVAYDSRSGNLYAVMISHGFGVIFSSNINNPSSSNPASVFAYKPTTQTYTEDYDDVGSIKVNAAGSIDMFLNRSGFFLEVTPPTLVSSDIVQNVQKQCGTNCWITIQKEFNPSNFTTDCSDYLGTGQCGLTKMSKLGPPIVTSFQYNTNGKIKAWYVHRGLDKSLLQSPDILYSFSNVYAVVPFATGPSNEFSNVYIPVKGQYELKEDGKTKTIDAPVPTAIRFFNYGNGGLKVGRELENVNGNIRINMLAPSENLPGYDREVINEKLDCTNTLNNMVSGLHLYFSNNGLVPVVQNPSSQASTPPGGGSSSSNNSSVNSGPYCEEKWCVPDEVPFGNGAIFKGDTNNRDGIKDKIITYLSRRNPGLASRYPDAVGKLCAAGSKYGVSCAFLAAIWVQESGAAINDNYALGCLNNKPAFVDQVECSAETLFNRYNEYKPGVVLTGPSDVDPTGKTSSKFRGPYLTNTDRGGGGCVAATRFSYVFQKYTPIDKRINNDNQCNKGLVVRSGDDQSKYCKNDAPKRSCGPNDPDNTSNGVCTKATNDQGVVVNPAVWGDAVETRPNLQYILQQINDPLIDANYNRCFPSSSGGSSTSSDPNIQKVLDQYDTSITAANSGTMRINLKNWGTDDAAGNIYMVLNVNMKDAYPKWVQATQAGQSFDITSYVDNKGIQGAYVIDPGSQWSFNDAIGNVSGDFVEKAVVPKLATTKAPWNSGNFNFDPNFRCKTTDKDGKVVINPGCGWCEMATSVRLASERAKTTDGKTLSQSTFQGAAAVAANTTYGTGGGWKGDINHWSHSGVTVSTFNALVASGESGLGDVTKYVSIVTNPGNSTDLNDGDLIIKNPYTGSSDPKMILTIQLSNDGIVTIQIYFGKAKSAPTNGPR